MITKEQLVEQVLKENPNLKYLSKDKLHSFIVAKYPEYSEENQNKQKEQLQETTRFTGTNIETGGIKGRTIGNINYVPPSGTLSDNWSIFDFAKKGVNESLTGMAKKIVTGEEMFDISDREFSFLEQVGSEIVSFMVPTDLLLFMVPGGFTTKLFMSGVKKQVAKKLITHGTLKEGVAKEVTERAVNKYLSEKAPQFLTKTGAAISGGMGSLGTYSVLGDIEAQKLEQIEAGELEAGIKGLVTPYGINWRRTAQAGAIGTVSGAAIGVAGGGLRAAKELPFGKTTAGKIATSVPTQLATETAALTGVHAAGGEDITLESVAHTLGTIGGIRLAHGAWSKAREKLVTDVEDSEVVKKAYERILRIEGLDVATNKKLLKEIKKIETDNSERKTQIEEIERKLEEGELTDAPEPEAPKRFPKKAQKGGEYYDKETGERYIYDGGNWYLKTAEGKVVDLYEESPMYSILEKARLSKEKGTPEKPDKTKTVTIETTEKKIPAEKKVEKEDESLFHETSPESARNLSMSNMDVHGLHVSTDISLALGQKGKGVIIEYFKNILLGNRGTLKKDPKPSSEFVGKEFTVQGARVRPEAVKRIIIKKGTKMSPLEVKAFRNNFNYKKLKNGDFVLTPKGKGTKTAKLKEQSEKKPSVETEESNVKFYKGGQGLPLTKTEKVGRKKELGTYKAEQTESAAGIKQEVARELRIERGIKDGDIYEATPEQIHDYIKWIESNTNATTREMLADEALRTRIYKLTKDDVKGLEGLSFFTKMLLPTTSVIRRRGGGMGAKISDLIETHFYDHMIFLGEGHKFRKILTGRKFLNLSKKELDLIVEISDKELVEIGELSELGKKWYKDIHGEGIEGEKGYVAPDKKSKAWQANRVYQETMNYYWKKYTEIMLNHVGNDLKRREDFLKLEKYLKDRKITDYVPYSLTQEMRKILISNKGNAKEALIEKVYRELKEKNEKLPEKRRYNEDDLIQIATGKVEGFVNFDITKSKLHSANFELTRGVKLPNYVYYDKSTGKYSAEKTLGAKKIKVYDTTFSSIDSYMYRNAHWLASVKNFLRETGASIDMERAGLKIVPEGEYATHITLLERVNKRIGDYTRSTVEKTLMNVKDPVNDAWYRAVNKVTGYAAWTGLSSPFSGMKNWMIADIQNVTAYGFRAFLKSYFGLFDSRNWMKTQGVGGFEVGGHLWEDIGLSKYNPGLMRFTEDANRVKSVVAAEYASTQATRKLRGETIFLNMTNNYAEHLLKNVFKLSEAEFKNVVDYGLDPKINSVIMAGKEQAIIDIKKKILHYGHINTQGATAPAFLPLWSSSNMGRSLTLFYRMAYRSNVNFANNVATPLVNGNPLPLLRYTGATLLTGKAIYEMYDSVLGMQIPTELSDEWNKAVDYAGRAEILGAFTNAISPYDRGFVETYQPVIIRHARDIVETIANITTGKKRAGVAFQDYIEDTFVIWNHSKRAWRNALQSKPEYKHIVNQKKVRTLVSAWLKQEHPSYYKRKTAMEFNLTDRSPYLRDLTDAFFLGSDEDMGRKYWSALFYITDELAKEKGYGGDTRTKYMLAIEDATKILESRLKGLRPVNLKYDIDGGKEPHTYYKQFMNFVKEKDINKYKEIKNLEQYYGKRLAKFSIAIKKYNEKDKFMKHLRELKTNP